MKNGVVLNKPTSSTQQQAKKPFVTSSSERAKRLRQSNPFFAILNNDERSKLAAELGEQV